MSQQGSHSSGRHQLADHAALVAVALALAGWGFAVPAQAAFPGQNGKIAFTAGRDDNPEIYVMEPDGGNQTNLTNHDAADGAPAWSADGGKIAFTSDRDGTRDVFVMDAGGRDPFNLTGHPAADDEPSWSPDGTRIAFHSNRSGNFEVFVMNADGTGVTNLTNHPSFDGFPSWSPDGERIAFTSARDGNEEVYVMDAEGSGQKNLTNHPEPDGGASWSPDGAKIAYQALRTVQVGDQPENVHPVMVMDADGTDQTPITAPDGWSDAGPAWSPDGTKIAFFSDRDVDQEIYVMGSDGSGQENLTKSADFDLEPDWQPLPVPGDPEPCGDTVLQLDRATVQGPLAETEPGSRIFRAGPGSPVYVGGFELRPRVGGALLVDMNSGSLREEGTGVQVFFGRFEVPLGVASIPVNLPEATFPLGRDGTLVKTLVALPITGQVKAAWTDDGGASGLELELESEKLVGDFGSFRGSGVTAPSLKLTAKQANCTGFDFTGAEVKADELSFIPTKLRVPRKLGLRNLLFKFQDDGASSSWIGQGELILPTGKGELSVGGKVSIADSQLAGLGISAGGINKSIGYGLFLQRVEGEMAFRPELGGNFGVNATLGPVIEDKKLVELTGNLKFFALANECTSGDDPIALVGTGKIPLVDELGAGAVKLEITDCIYTDSIGIEQSAKVEAVFGEVVGGEIPNPVVAVKANLTGFVGETGINAEGGGSVTIPVVGEVAGQALLSTEAFAACGRVGFFSGGAAHRWGQPRTEAFTGCDLAPWRAGAAASAFAAGLPEPPLAYAARTSTTVPVGRKLPFVGWAAEGLNGPPVVRVTGPRGERFTSRPGRALVRRDVVIVPVAAEGRTFVFVRSPSRGRWGIEGVGERLARVRTAEGLPKPKVRGDVGPVGVRQVLTYRLVPLRGQRVTFYERTDDGVARPIGRARGRRGRIVFTPASTGQPARIEALVDQNGLPRDAITVARFRAASPGAKPPARPRRLKVRRAGRHLVVSWARVRGAARYRVEVLAGPRRIMARTVTGTRLRVALPSATRPRIEVRAISGEGAASAPSRGRLESRRPQGA